MLAAVLLTYATAMFQPVDAATTSQPVQVFVHDNSAQAQPGDGGHDWGLRPPSINDADTAPLYNAHGAALKSLLGSWRTADGKATFDTAPQGATRVHVSFRGLVPNGRYSLFVRQRAVRMDAVFTPLDMVGAQNSFSADQQGNADAVVVTPLQLPRGAQLVAFYHSDGVDHQSSLGNPGVNAHAQLILRVP
jgi:hypothetical protein